MQKWIPSINSVRKFREALQSHDGALGPFMISTDPGMYEAAGLAGYDFVLIDMEHGLTTFNNLVDIIRGCNSVDVCPIVRIPRGTDIWISRALDVGAGAVFVPQVETADEAAKIVDSAKFSPLGHRGLSKFVRAGAYNAIKDEDFYNAANETCVIIQAEGVKAINNITEIMKVPGIDVVFIGPYDLSSSLGLIGQVTHPEVIKQIEYIIATGEQYGVKIGCFADTVERGIELKKMGVRFIGYGTDINMFYKYCKNDVEKWNSQK